MRERLRITPWQYQPLDQMSQSACSPSGRPYSPYPYRDLPKTPEQPLSHALTKPAWPSPTHHHAFHFFPLLPTELRLQIWREAMLSACASSRVHRVRLAITYDNPVDEDHLFQVTATAATPTTPTTPMSSISPTTTSPISQTSPTTITTTPTLRILPTAHLAASTYATRALLSSCSEARRELLPPSSAASTFLPDTLPLHCAYHHSHPERREEESSSSESSSLPFQPSKARGGVVRLNLARDLVLLDSLSADLLLQLADARYFAPGLLAPLRGVRRLGLDVGGLLSSSSSSVDVRRDDDGDDGESSDGTSLPPEGAVVPPMVEMALVRLVGLLGGGRRLEGVYLLGGSAWLEGGGGSEGQVHKGVIPAQGKGEKEDQGKGYVFVGGKADSEWYTTRPFPSYYVDDTYHARLARLMRFLCQFRQAMDAPAVITDMDDEEVLERLEGTKLRFLRHYVSRPASVKPHGLVLSSPERCLEVALGREPRWVQWEWVCQCLDC